MGLRLEGVAVTQRDTAQMITEGVSLGAIQVPPGGAPIILFVEQQTTGGYPKIANVIVADLHRVGQLRPRDEIRFEVVTLDAARSLLIEQERLLASRELILE
jgi:allophanate hydrolase subunit 2